MYLRGKGDLWRCIDNYFNSVQVQRPLSLLLVNSYLTDILRITQLKSLCILHWDSIQFDEGFTQRDLMDRNQLFRSPQGGRRTRDPNAHSPLLCVIRCTYHTHIQIWYIVMCWYFYSVEELDKAINISNIPLYLFYDEDIWNISSSSFKYTSLIIISILWNRSLKCIPFKFFLKIYFFFHNTVP